MESPPGRGALRGRSRLTIAALMGFVAGSSLALWLVLKDVKDGGPDRMLGLVVWVYLLGGVSLVGPPLLLIARRGRRTALFGAGRVLWFAEGIAAWLLWPPIIYRRIHGVRVGDTASGICYFYGTPLMAVYVTAALLAGGWLRPRRRRQAARSWEERFGLLLGLAWACTGLYVLYSFYREDFSK